MLADREDVANAFHEQRQGPGVRPDDDCRLVSRVREIDIAGRRRFINDRLPIEERAGIGDPENLGSELKDAKKPIWTFWEAGDRWHGHERLTDGAERRGASYAIDGKSEELRIALARTGG